MAAYHPFHSAKYFKHPGTYSNKFLKSCYGHKHGQCLGYKIIAMEIFTENIFF